jgi:hypothetical protein
MQNVGQYDSNPDHPGYLWILFSVPRGGDTEEVQKISIKGS